MTETFDQIRTLLRDYLVDQEQGMTSGRRPVASINEVLKDGKSGRDKGRVRLKGAHDSKCLLRSLPVRIPLRRCRLEKYNKDYQGPGRRSRPGAQRVGPWSCEWRCGRGRSFHALDVYRHGRSICDGWDTYTPYQARRFSRGYTLQTDAGFPGPRCSGPTSWNDGCRTSWNRIS